ncbi:MAG TPA: DNA-binding protein [Candidatus Latescibacteria bacterium]|mgnify:FL=1|nr:DNA-binding protein [Candidatus Handelsmanbacteria bacterium]HIL07524.1 DNA-binding protein [Candidatus Latescibacterota bacterium]
MSDANNGEAKPQLLYTPEEAAVALRISRTHLYQLKSAKQISYIKIGKNLRFRRKDLDDYIAKCAKKAATEIKRSRVDTTI